MEQLLDSDRNSATMLATKAFEKIIDEIRESNLNFQLQMTPFAAHISLKRSLIKEKSGVPRLPSTLETKSPKDPNSQSIIEALVVKNLQLEQRVNDLKEELTSIIDNSRASFLFEQKDLNIKKESEDDMHINILEDEIKNLKVENEEFREKFKEQKQEIGDLENIVKTKGEISNNLNKKLSEIKIKNDKECVALKKMHKTEVKAWKKELGQERREKIKLEKELKIIADEQKNNHVNKVKEPEPLSSLPPSAAEFQCSICGVEIANFKPKYLLGEMFNPACSNCDDSFEGDNTGPDHTGCKHEQQCVLRQPYPPPSPSMPFLVNESSKYHEHMMSRAGVPGRYPGHERCMDAYSKNYGCEDCVWLKWHGELHGYPDIHPADFRKYLEPAEWNEVQTKLL